MINNLFNTENKPYIDFERAEKSIDDLIKDAYLIKEYHNFRFPKDFSFQNKEHREAVGKLYCRKNFSIKTGEDRDLRKAVRKNYQKKCKDYFLEEYQWPQGVANTISKMIVLPDCKEHKTTAGYALRFVPAAFIGCVPERFVEPLAKMMNIEREFFTFSSIAYGTAQVFISSYVAYQMWKGENHDMDLLAKIYDSFGVGSEIIKWWASGSAAARVIEAPIRIYKFAKDKSHTFSPASCFPFNLNFVDGIPFAHLAIYDAKMNYEDNQKPKPKMEVLHASFAKENPPKLYDAKKLGKPQIQSDAI
jgi:hypothetical protein